MVGLKIERKNNIRKRRELLESDHGGIENFFKFTSSLTIIARLESDHGGIENFLSNTANS